MIDHRSHLPAVRAVARDRSGVPNCSDVRLTVARDAGLIVFKDWPAGHWQLTPAGRSLLHADADQAGE